MAEPELSVLTRQCLGTRLGSTAQPPAGRCGLAIYNRGCTDQAQATLPKNYDLTEYSLLCCFLMFWIKSTTCIQHSLDNEDLLKTLLNGLQG